MEIVCDKKTKEAFVQECKKIIQEYVLRKEECYGYEDPLIIGTFNKYYKETIEDKYDAKFSTVAITDKKAKLNV